MRRSNAEISEKQARSIRYQLTITKLPLAKDLEDFVFEGTPINETLVNEPTEIHTWTEDEISLFEKYWPQAASEIAAITGHKTLAEVERYTRAAEQKRLARQAIQRQLASGSGKLLAHEVANTPDQALEINSGAP